MINYTPRLFIVVGSPASGKDELIKAVNTLGNLHARIVPKHTDRNARWDDDNEMICKKIFNSRGELVDNSDYDLENCDITYLNYGTNYGIKTSDIWNGFQAGIHQVLVVSNVKALNELKTIFGKLAVFLYVYSSITKDEYMKKEQMKMAQKNMLDSEGGIEYLKRREENFDMAWNLYERNFNMFDHVFIYANKEEDLFDQIFRLFRYYENRV